MGTNIPPRFWAKVKPSGDCLVWGGGKTSNGYGRFGIGSRTDNSRRLVSVHRHVYEDQFGPIPDGLEIDHLCRNPLCVRLDHLEVVTRRENILRSECVSVKNARKTHCPQGHPYAGSNLAISLPTSTHSACRRCRACNRVRTNKRRQEVRLAL